MNTRSPRVLTTGALEAIGRVTAQAIVFIASGKARFLTGQRLAVDGGFTAQ